MPRLEVAIRLIVVFAILFTSLPPLHVAAQSPQLPDEQSAEPTASPTELPPTSEATVTPTAPLTVTATTPAAVPDTGTPALLPTAAVPEQPPTALPTVSPTPTPEEAPPSVLVTNNPKQLFLPLVFGPAVEPVAPATMLTTSDLAVNRPTLFKDTFNTLAPNFWVWSSHQSVYNDAGVNVVRNIGEGNNSNAHFYRNAATLVSGEAISIRFKVDNVNSAAYFSLESTEAGYQRFGLVASNGKLTVEVIQNGTTTFPKDLITNLQLNTWYVLRINLDDTFGFGIAAKQENNPANYASYTQPMPTGRKWRFHHWLYRNTAWLDDYQEFVYQDVRFSDPFTAKNNNDWGWNSYQTVINEGSNSVIRNVGTGNSWDANFYRSSDNLTDGQGVIIRFKVDNSNTSAHFAIQTNENPYSRFGVVADQGKLYVEYNQGNGWFFPKDLITNVQLNTWYIVKIWVDDVRGFVVAVCQENNPAVSGFHRQVMPASKQWRFYHWNYRHTVYLDDYQEFVWREQKFTDTFDTKTNNWVWNNYQTVPFGYGGNNIVRNIGTGSNWNAHFYRSAYNLVDGQGVKIRFMVDNLNTIAHYAIESNSNGYNRFGLVADGGKLYAQYNEGNGFVAAADLITNLQLNTWYLARIRLDDIGGFTLDVRQHNNPAIYASYNKRMPAGKQWGFHHWNYRNTAYFDAYEEFDWLYLEQAIAGLNATTSSPTTVGAPTTLNASVIHGTDVAYTWSFGDGTSGSGPLVSHVYPAPGIYTARVTAANSLGTTSATTQVTIHDQTIADLMAANNSPTSLGQSTSFTASVSSGSNVTYNWVFGDGATASGAKVTHDFTQPGSYTAIVTATNSMNTAAATTLVTVFGTPVLTLTKTAPEAVVAGTPITYTLHVTNTGTATATNLTISDTLPSGANYVQGGNRMGNEIYWNIPALASGATTQVTFIVTATSTLTNSSYQVTADGGVSASGPVAIVTNVYQPPTADFEMMPPVGPVPLTVGFTNNSTNANSYTWDLGDGAFSNLPSPTHTYTQTGLYTVTLTATGPGGNASTSRLVTVTGLPYLTIGKTGPLTAIAGNPITYTLTITNSGLLTATNLVITDALPGGASYVAGGVLMDNTVRWDMAELPPNSSSTVQFSVTATETITNSNYRVSADEGFSATGTEAIVTLIYPPVTVDFEATPLTGTAPLTITFATSSTGASDYLWDFGDGVTQSLTSSLILTPSALTTTHTYTQPGVYTVTLTAAGPGGSDSLTQTSYITVYTPVAADFSATPMTGTVPLTVTFVNSSTGATDYLWDFGDGVTQTLTSPLILPPSALTTTHTYTQPGVYTVTLTAGNGFYTNTLTYTNFITAITATDATTPSAKLWWNDDFFYRRPLIVSPNTSISYDSALTQVVKLTLDTSQLVAEGKLRSDGNDLRIVYQAGDQSWVELARQVQNVGSSTTTVLFPIQAAITSTITHTYWLYYGNFVANTPPLLMEDYAQAELPYLTVDPEGEAGLAVDFVAAPVSDLAPLAVTFTNLTPPEAGSYSWDFGDGNTSSLTDTVHTYQTPGIYSVRLTALSAEVTSTQVQPGLIWVAGLDISDRVAVTLDNPEETPVVTATVTASITDTQVITMAEGNFSVAFPTGATPQDLVVTHQPYRAEIRQDYGLLTRFDITAQAAAGGQPVTQFSRPLTFTLDLSRYQLSQAVAQTVRFFTWNETTRRWERIPTTLSINSNGQFAYGQINHFSTYMAVATGQTGGPPPLGAVIRSTMTDSASGAATFSIPIAAPPGTASMQPAVSISYNSLQAQAEMEIRSREVPGLLGLGTSLNLSYIARARRIDNIADIRDPQLDDFVLVMNGRHQELIPEGEGSDLYRTRSEGFWRIRRISQSCAYNMEVDCTYWQVTTTAGTIFTFGQTLDSTQEALTSGLSQNGSDVYRLYTYPGRFYLNRVEDINGNAMVFEYTKQKQPFTLDFQGETADTGWYDAEVYLTNIRYTENSQAGLSFQRRVSFNYEARGEGSITDNRYAYLAGIEPVYHYNQRLQSIETWVEPYSSSPVHRYIFEYSYLTKTNFYGTVINYFTDTISDSTVIHYLTLRGVSVQGEGGATFPLSTRFSYYDVPPPLFYDTTKFGLLRRVITQLAGSSENYNEVKYEYDWQTLPFLAGRGLASQWLVSRQTQEANGVEPEVINYRYETFTRSIDNGSVVNLTPLNPEDRIGQRIFDRWIVGSHHSLSRQTTIQAFHSSNLIDTAPLAGQLAWSEVFSDPTAACLETSFFNLESTCSADRYLSGQYFTYEQRQTAATEDDQAYFVAPASVVRAIGPVSSGQPTNWTRTNYEYDDYGNLSGQAELNDPANPDDDRVTQMTYSLTAAEQATNILNRPLTVVSYPNHCTRYLYTTAESSAALSQVTQQTFRSTACGGFAPLDLQSTVTFNALGQVIASEGAGGNYQVEYDPLYFTFPITTTYPVDGEPLTNRASYNPASGQVTQAIAMNGAATNYMYDGFGRPATITSPASGAAVTYNYNYSDNGLTVSQTHTDAGEQLTTEQYYNGLGQLLADTNPGENGQTIRTTYEYNQGRLWRSSVPYSIGQGPTLWLTFAYDDWGRSTAVTHPDGSVKRTEYTGWTQQRVIDENGHIRAYTRDALGQVTQVDEYTGTLGSESLYATTTYAYNGLGHLTDVLDQAGNLTHMEYDATGRMILLQDPNQGEWRYTYSRRGPLVRQESPRGMELAFLYDPQNRLTEITRDITEVGRESYVQFTYDTGLNGQGQRASMADTSGQTSYSYDPAGRLITATRTIDGIVYQTGFSYDPLNRVKTLTYPDGEVITYNYNRQGLLEGLTTPGNLQISQIDYNVLGQPTQLLGSNGLNWQYSYYDQTSGAPQLTLQSVSKQVGGTGLSFNYQYDPAGRLSQQSGNIGGLAQNLSYTYDALNRLTRVSGSAAGFDLSRSYTYNPIGNLTSKDGLAFSYLNPDNRPVHAPSQVGTTTYGYDPDGNRVSQNNNGLSAEYRYDELNRLAYVISDTLAISGTTRAVTQNVSDGDGQRVKRITAEGTTVTIGQHYEVFYPASPNQTLELPETACMYPPQGMHTGPRLAANSQGLQQLAYQAGFGACSATLNNAGQVIWSSGNGGSYANPYRLFEVELDEAGNFYLLGEDVLNGTPYLRLTNATVATGTTTSAADMALATGSSIHVVWSETESGRLRHAQVNGSVVNESPALIETGAAAPRLAVDSTGLAHVVWQQSEDFAYTIRYTTPGSPVELISTTACPANASSAPVIAVDAADQLYVAWSAQNYSICLATRPANGAWSVTQLPQRSDTNHLELEVSSDGQVLYLLRGVRVGLEDLERKGDFAQETLYLDRYRNGAWASLPVNTYPGQDGGRNDNFTDSLLNGDLDIDAQGNAYIGWIDNGPAWSNSTSLRLRTTTILSTTAPTITKHYFANGQRMASWVDGQLYYTLGDHLGSTSLVVDAQGNQVGYAIYDAYGQIVTNTIPATLTDRLFTGQVFDASTGLYYYKARFYDPASGQFTQPDSLIPDALNPAAWNRYSYVYGNPVGYSDPTGHAPWDVLDIASFGMSLNDFMQDPSLANAGWLALDTIGLLPLVPGVGSLHHAGKLDDLGDAGRAACAFNSFPAGTMVHTETGLVSIEWIKVGDKVLAQDPDTGESGYFEVVELFSHPTDDVLRVTVGDNLLAAEIMTVTPNHPIYVEGRGWVSAADLAVGDTLRRADGGWATVLAVERTKLDTPEMVYNFTVKGVHTYFVLEVGVLVHNCSDKFKAKFASLYDNLNILDQRAARFGSEKHSPRLLLQHQKEYRTAIELGYQVRSGLLSEDAFFKQIKKLKLSPVKVGIIGNPRTKNDFKELLFKLYEHLNGSQEAAADYGGAVDLLLTNKIDDYQVAISWTYDVLAGKLDKDEFLRQTKIFVLDY